MLLHLTPKWSILNLKGAQTVSAEMDSLIFFVEYNVTPSCLMSKQEAAVLREYEQHYYTEHVEQYREKGSSEVVSKCT